jgi:hypothetical protein
MPAEGLRRGWGTGGSGLVFLAGAAGERGRRNQCDDLVDVVDPFCQGGAGLDFCGGLDGGEQEVEVTLELRTVLVDGGKVLAALGGDLVGHEALKFLLFAYEFGKQGVEAEGGEVCGGGGAAQIGDEFVDLGGFLDVAESVEGIAVVGENLHEAGGGAAHASAGGGRGGPSGGEVPQADEGGIPRGIREPQWIGEAAAILAGSGEDQGAAVLLSGSEDLQQQRLAGEGEDENRVQAFGGGSEFSGGEEVGKEWFHRLCRFCFGKIAQ